MVVSSSDSSSEPDSDPSWDMSGFWEAEHDFDLAAAGGDGGADLVLGMGLDCCCSNTSIFSMRSMAFSKSTWVDWLPAGSAGAGGWVACVSFSLSWCSRSAIFLNSSSFLDLSSSILTFIELSSSLASPCGVAGTGVVGTSVSGTGVAGTGCTLGDASGVREAGVLLISLLHACTKWNASSFLVVLSFRLHAHGGNTRQPRNAWDCQLWISGFCTPKPTIGFLNLSWVLSYIHRYLPWMHV